jgi:hypothetical protein
VFKKSTPRLEEGFKWFASISTKGNKLVFDTVADDGKRWTGKIPQTRDYFIYLVAHPTAPYVLRVTVK